MSIEGTPLLGAIEDKRKAATAAASEPTASASSLRVRAFALFGGIELKS